MPAEKPKQNTKQMITLVATVLIFLVVAYEVYGMFAGGDSGTPAPAPTQQAANQPRAGGGGGPSAAAAAPAADQEALAPKHAPVQVNPELQRLQQDTEAKYLAALNELEMLKIQKQIADTKEGITSATLATATAEKSITDLLTLQQGPMGAMGPNGGPMATGPYSSTALSPTSPTSPTSPNPPPSTGTTTTSPAPTPTPVPRMMAAPEAPYMLQSVSYKDMRWNAVLSIDNKFYNVTIGDTLPVDDSVVTSIDRNSVVLQSKDKKLRRIMMVPSLG